MTSSKELVNAIMAVSNQGGCCCDKRGWRLSPGKRLKGLFISAALAAIMKVLGTDAAKETILETLNKLCGFLGSKIEPVFALLAARFPEIADIKFEVDAQAATPLDFIPKPTQHEERELGVEHAEVVMGFPKINYMQIRDAPKFEREAKKGMPKQDSRSALDKICLDIDFEAMKERFQSLDSVRLQTITPDVPDLRELENLKNSPPQSEFSSDNEVVRSDDLFAVANDSIEAVPPSSTKSEEEIQEEEERENYLQKFRSHAGRMLAGMRQSSQIFVGKTEAQVVKIIEAGKEKKTAASGHLQRLGRQTLDTVASVRDKITATVAVAKDAEVPVIGNQRRLEQLPTMDQETGVRPLNHDNPLVMEPGIIDVCRDEESRKKLASFLLEWEVQSQALATKCTHLFRDFREWVTDKFTIVWRHPNKLQTLLDRTSSTFLPPWHIYRQIINQPQLMKMYIIKTIMGRMYSTKEWLKKSLIFIMRELITGMFSAASMSIKFLIGLPWSRMLKKLLKNIRKHPWIFISSIVTTRYLIWPRMFDHVLRLILTKRTLTIWCMKSTAFRKYVVEQWLLQSLINM